MKVLITNPNFLILDEPTNDFDIDTLNVLEDFLDKFSGCLILVSHDRYFMDKLTEHLFVFKGIEEIDDFPGNYSDYKNYLEQQEKESNDKAKKTKDKKNTLSKTGQKRKLSYSEKKEFESLEHEIAELELMKKVLVDKMNLGSKNHEELMDWAAQIEQLTIRIEEKEFRWLELSELT